MKARSVLFVFLLIAMLATACRSNNPPPPTVQPTPAGDQVWNKIMSSGKIVFGSSLDYAPFESYDQYFQPTGFDIALAREVGARLGLQVEFRDMAFEGLLPSVQAQQVDAGIAAISVTPERQQTIDFSNIYYNDKTSALSRQGSGIKITSPNQLASYRVGVQRGTVYEQWIKTTLIDTGLMPATNLFTYQQPDHAVEQLEVVAAFFGLKGTPGELADAYGVEACFLHQAGIGGPPLAWPILGVVCCAEVHGDLLIDGQIGA